MNINEIIGERIRLARTRKDWNQSDLARAVNKPRQHISQVEQGKQQPRAELLIDIADALGVTIDYLLGRTPVPDTEADLAAAGRS
jgi:transcriptional regulator with XRE-family HTH domain